MIHRLDVVSAGTALRALVSELGASTPVAVLDEEATARIQGWITSDPVRRIRRRPRVPDRTRPLGKAEVEGLLTRTHLPLRERTLWRMCSTRPPPEPRKSWHWTSRNWIRATGGPRSAARATLQTSSRVIPPRADAEAVPGLVWLCLVYTLRRSRHHCPLTSSR